MKQQGFSLIELMIVVAIIGILSAIALPAYSSYIERTHRSIAGATLHELANFMERYYTANGRYVDSGGTAPSLPYAQSPSDSSAVYSVALTASASTYTLTATPISGGRMDGDTCGALSLQANGVKSVSGSASVAECWR
ncbi:type IV pilin protein [Salinibius halmophilus]|uniref:type IV pilin protein n=1 Tax=Salinibius halmophilus TaxID=1853216 RepID=UPI000E6720FB|nr:type IV pilin protein [Salinibius halmophilus]